MPYKRRARVVFLGTPEQVALACEAAAREGADWIQTGEPEKAVYGWADLVVTLDQSARESLPPLPATTRHKHWPVACKDDISRRVRGMIGGLRLLSRLDASSDE